MKLPRIPRIPEFQVFILGTLTIIAIAVSTGYAAGQYYGNPHSICAWNSKPNTTSDFCRSLLRAGETSVARGRR